MNNTISDHIRVTSRNGKIIAIPCWQIRTWIESGRFSLQAGKANFDSIGYAFADEEAGPKQYAAWLADEERKRKKASFDASVPRDADTGFASAHLKPAQEPNVFDQPPPPPVGTENNGSDQAKGRSKPKDVI